MRKFRLVPKYNCHQTSTTILLSALKSCSTLKDLDSGRKLHSDSVQTGDFSNVFVGNILLSMYANCGVLNLAEDVFERLAQRDVVTWNTMLMGYVENGEPERALNMFFQMQSEELCKPNGRSYVSAVMACTSLREQPVEGDKKNVSLGSLERGMAVHSLAVSNGLDTDVFVASSLVDMYSRFGSILDFRVVFDRVVNPDLVLWNALIFGYAENDEEELALELYECMNCLPDTRTFIAVFVAFTGVAVKQKRVESLLHLERARCVHSQATEMNHDKSIFMANTLVDMYSKFGSMTEARDVFEGIKSPTVVSWTALMLGYVDNDESEQALKVFEQMKTVSNCQPNARTFVAALSACVKLAEGEQGREVAGKLVKVNSLEKGMEIHSQAVKSSCDSDLFVSCTVIDVYSKCGSMLDARMVFDRMEAHDVVSWTAIISGYVEAEPKLVLELFESRVCPPNALTYISALKACSHLAASEQGMTSCLETGRRLHAQASSNPRHFSLVLQSSVLDMYVKCGSLVDAKAVFDGMFPRDVVSWTALILGHAESGKAEKAIELFKQMRAECQPDARAYAAVLVACGILAELGAGRKLHAEILRAGLVLEHDSVLTSSILTFYAKSGCMNCAEIVFNSLVPSKSSVSYTAMITGYSQQGDVREAFRLLSEMMEHENDECRPNRITLISVLAACSHSGRVEEGKRMFERMVLKYGVEPGVEHFECMVDLLGRANQLEEAVSLVGRMPHQPSAMAWTSLLGACVKWKNLEAGKLVFESLLRVDEKQSSAYILMYELLFKCM